MFPLSDPIPDDLFAAESPPAAPEIVVRRAEPKPTVVFDTYWRFAAERQAIYFRRLRGERVRVAECGDCAIQFGHGDLSRVDGHGVCPHRVRVLAWTADPILQQYRFTNCYRAADRVSQYLIRNVIHKGDNIDPLDVAFRVILFKIFNRPSTWETLIKMIGEWPEARRFSVERYGRALADRVEAGDTLYSAAYVMPNPDFGWKGARSKPWNHMALIASLIDGQCVGRRLLEARSLRDAFDLLRAVPSFGDFLAYQYAIDLNYSDVFHFDEDEFVVPGPGARDGIRKCFSNLGDYNEADVIRWTCDRQEQEFDRLGLRFETLFGRRLYLIDTQNIFCEISKYARVAHPDVVGRSGRTKIKQSYRPDPNPLPLPFFPLKWGINHLIGARL